MTSALVPFTFNSIKLFTITINDKPWTRAKEICQSLNYARNTPNVISDHVSPENRVYKYQLVNLPAAGKSVKWPTDSRKDEYYINEQGMYELAFTSQQKEAKEFRKYCCNTLFPQIRQKLVDIDLESSNRRHQLAIEDMGREQLETRAVPYLEDPKKDNSMVVIQKNNGDEYQYIAICGQQGYVAQKIQNKLIDFQNGQIVVLAETPNAICHYNYLRERGCIEVNPDRVRHFRLGRNLRHQDLLGIQDA